MNCDTCRDQLSEFDAGELSRGAHEEVERHVASCGECRDLLRAMRHATALARRLPDEAPARSRCVRILAQVSGLLSAGLPDAPEVMTPEELARFLKVPPGALDDWVEDIPAFEVAGQLRFRKSRVLEWIEANERRRGLHVAYAQLRAV